MSSRDVDAGVLALLGATILNVYDGYVTDSDEKLKTISASLPYVVLYSTPGRPINPRMGGTPKGRAVEFQITSVGKDRTQTKWAGDEAEDALNGKVVTVNGKPRRINRDPEDNAYLTRDDTWNRPDGGPLFTDVRRYTVAI